jgi:hypothetical protein
MKVRPTAKALVKNKIDQNSSNSTPVEQRRDKIAMLRQEASLQMGRLHVLPNSNNTTKTAHTSSSFGNAVAFAAVSKKGGKQKLTTTKYLGNGKHMKVPVAYRNPKRNHMATSTSAAPLLGGGPQQQRKKPYIATTPIHTTFPKK